MKLHRLASITLILTFFYNSILPPNVSCFSQMRRVTKVEYTEDCEKDVYPIQFTKFACIYLRNESVLNINGVHIVTRDIKSPTAVRYLIEKCADKSNPDTCKYFATWKWDDMKQVVGLPFVKPFMEFSTPPITWPIKKNTYYIKNARINADLMAAFLSDGDSNTLWRLNLQFFEDKVKKVGCVNFGVRFMNVRVRVG